MRALLTTPEATYHLELALTESSNTMQLLTERDRQGRNTSLFS
jgi:hypothetical protein